MNGDIYLLFLNLQTFSANTDKDSPVTINFPAPISTKLLRIKLTSCNNWCSLRFEVFGCLIGGKITLLEYNGILTDSYQFARSEYIL